MKHFLVFDKETFCIFICLKHYNDFSFSLIHGDFIIPTFFSIYMSISSLTSYYFLIILVEILFRELLHGFNINVYTLNVDVEIYTFMKNLLVSGDFIIDLYP